MTAETSNARGEWVLVPRVPTKAMIDAWRDAPDIWGDAYAAMLAAAPQPPSAPVGVEGLARLLERIRDLLASLPVDCLGSGTDASGQPYPIRDEVIHGITKALAQQPAAVDEAAAIRAFEEHFEANAEDPSLEGELELWLTAWRKALDSAPQQPVAVDVAAAKRAVAAVMSAPDGISVEAFFRIVLEAAVAAQHQDPTT